MGDRWPLPDSNLPSSPHTVVWYPPLHSNPIQPSIDNFTPWTDPSTTSDGATLSGPAAYADYSMAYVPILPVNVPIPNYPAMQSQELPAYSVPSNANSDLRQSMPPPALNPRKRKAPTLRAEDWTPVKARIIELHIDDNMPLPEVKIAIEEEFPFEATLRQYRSAVTSWGFDKNVKKNVMQAIVRKRQHRRLVEPGKKDLNFKVHNFTVNPEKVDTWMKRNNIPGDTIYAPSPAASTPSEMMAWTPSEQASSPSGGPSSSHTPTAMAIQSPQGGYGSTIHSSAPSVSSILESHDSDFTGQSPAPWLTNDEAPTHPYLSADEAHLRLQLSLHREQSGLDDNLDALHSDLFALQQVIYKSGFDLLKALWLVATRKTPQVNLGAVDMSCAFVVCDVTMNDCPIIYVSDNFQNLTGYSRHEIIGQNCRFLQAPDSKVEAGTKREFVDNSAVYNLKRKIAEGKEVQQSLINYKKGGKPFLNLLTMIPIPWDTSEIRYIVGFQIDLVECPDAISSAQEAGSMQL